MKDDKRIIIALDFPNIITASTFAHQIRRKARLKAGLELNTAAGTPVVVQNLGSDIFLDLKFKDIPHTVAGAVAAASRQNVWMLNVHCMGGKEMMQAARDAAIKVYLEEKRLRRTLIIGVTVLTSQDRAGLTEIGIDPNLSMEVIVAKLAVLAHESKLDGVVCSPHEVPAIKKAVGDDKFLTVTPGIRHKKARPDDQKRTATAREAANFGADYLVIGRPITQAVDPLAAVEEFQAEIA